MSVRKGYNRYFIIFQEEDKGYGIAIDKQPTGYAKIEVRNGKCKITVYAQNIKQEKGPYNFCMIDTEKNPADVLRLGEVRIDEIGTGETFWEYSEDNIGGSGQSVDRYNVAVLLADEDNLLAPLSGFSSKERIQWKDKLLFAQAKTGMQRATSFNAAGERETDYMHDSLSRAEENELDEEALRIQEYEQQLRDEIDQMKKEGVAQDFGNNQELDFNADPSYLEEFDELSRRHSHGKSHGKSKQQKHKQQEDCECDNEQESDHSSSSEDHIGQEKPMHYEAMPHMHKPCGYYAGCGEYGKPTSFDDWHMKQGHPMHGSGDSSHDHLADWQEHDMSHDHMNNWNDDQSSNDHNKHDHKHANSYAAVFHQLLSEFEEVTDRFTCHHMEGSRWWRVPARYKERMIEERHYPYMCTIFHLSMAYPKVDYMKYFYKHGYYYFGIRYDNDGEVKRLMYGIPGHHTVREQPLMGMTGFHKWVGDTAEAMGAWLMFYNPRTGHFMVEKNK